MFIQFTKLAYILIQIVNMGNFFEVVSRDSETPLQVGENLNL